MENLNFRINSLLFNFVKWQIYTVISIKVEGLFGVKTLGYLMVSYSIAPIIGANKIGKIVNLVRIDKLLSWSSITSLLLLLTMYFCTSNIKIIYILSFLESVGSLIYYLSSRAYIRNCSLNKKTLTNNHSFLVINELIANTLGVFIGSLIFYKNEYVNLIISIILAIIGIISILTMPPRNFLKKPDDIKCTQNSYNKGFFISALCYVYGLAFLFGGTFNRFLINFTSSNFPENTYIYSVLSFCLGFGSIIGIIITVIKKDIKTSYMLYIIFFLYLFLSLNLSFVMLFNNEIVLSAISIFCGASLSASRRLHNFFIILYTDKREQSYYLAKSNSHYNAATVIGSFTGGYYIDLLGFKKIMLLSGIIIFILAIIVLFLIKKYYYKTCHDLFI